MTHISTTKKNTHVTFFSVKFSIQSTLLFVNIYIKSFTAKHLKKERKKSSLFQNYCTHSNVKFFDGTFCYLFDLEMFISRSMS